MLRISDLFRRHSGRRVRQHRTEQRSEVSVTTTEALEQRTLLTLGINFDFSVIASDLSTDLRLFGSNDPADAPLEVIRYASGSLTTLDGFDGGKLLNMPGDLTFEVGSMDVNNPVSIMTLDRNTFDGGVGDGIANQNYRLSVGGADIQFFHRGTYFAHASLLELSLEVTPEGVTTGFGRIGVLLQETFPESREYHQLRALLNDTFSENETGDETRGREFSLTPFNHNGAWAGVADAEISSSSGMMISGDDLPDGDLFAVAWDTSSPFFGVASHDQDHDWLKTNLDPNMKHTFRVSSTGDARLIDFTSDFFKPLAGENFDGRLLNDDNTTIATVFPRSPTTNIDVSQNDGTWRIDLIDSQPVSLNLYFVDDFELGWAPEYDAQGVALPADGYRIELSNSDGVFHTMDVDSATFRYSLAGKLGLSGQQVRVGRIVNGSVVTQSDARFLSSVRTMAEFTGFDGKTFTWKPIAGATHYELVLDNINTRRIISSGTTSYTLA